MPEPHASVDRAFMLEALALARPALGTVWPNPAVGCLVVQGKDVVGQGCTGAGGRPHAEPRAIVDAGEQARGATVYVTLEPCSHWGRTPPCTDALMAAGVARVVVAVLDPDPRVNGKGIARLRAAGLEVTLGACEEEARALNAGFFMRVEVGRPLVAVTHEPTPDLAALLEQGANFDVCLVGRARAHAWRAHASAKVRVLDPTSLPRALAELGEEGITRVLIACDDPAAQALREAELIDVRRAAGDGEGAAGTDEHAH